MQTDISILAQRNYDLGMIFDWGGIYSMISGFASTSTLDFGSGVVKREANAQKQIDRFIENIKSLD